MQRPSTVYSPPMPRFLSRRTLLRSLAAPRRCGRDGRCAFGESARFIPARGPARGPLGRAALRAAPARLGAAAPHLGGGGPRGARPFALTSPQLFEYPFLYLGGDGELPAALGGRGGEPPALPHLRRLPARGRQRRQRRARLRRQLPPGAGAGAAAEPARRRVPVDARGLQDLLPARLGAGAAAQQAAAARRATSASAPR